MEVEIYTDDRGVVMLKAPCYHGPGYRHQDPRQYVSYGVSGETGVIADGKFQSLGYPEQRAMASHWHKQNGWAEPVFGKIGGK